MTATTPVKHARPHLTTHTRSQGHSAVAGAAYRLGLKLTDARTGETHDFRKRKLGEEIVRAVTVAPTDSPAWATNPQELWNRVEASEKRKDSQVAHDYRVPIPFGLTDIEAGDLAEELARFISDELDVPVSVGLHRDADRDALGLVKAPDKQGFHAHLYFPTRALEVGAVEGDATEGRTGFGPKLTMLSNKREASAWVEYFNATWGERCNDYLARAGQPEVIDHRSYKRQGVDVIPQPKMGVSAAAMERRGMTTARGDVLREALVMAEVQKKVRVATVAAVHAGRRSVTPVSGLSASIADMAVPMAPSSKATHSASKTASIVITPRDVLPRAQRMVRSGAPGLKVTLAQQVAAAGPKPTSDAEQMALERAVELVSILEGFLQTASAQMKEHANLVQQARRAQQHAADLASRIEDSRRYRERARREVRDLTALHPVRIRLARSGLPGVSDPRRAKMALVAHHDRHVQEDKHALRTLRAAEAHAWSVLNTATAALDQHKARLQEVVVTLAHDNLPVLHQLLGFLPDDTADLVREAMKSGLVAVDETDDNLVDNNPVSVPGEAFKPRPASR
jgi:hypothetical protein